MVTRTRWSRAQQYERLFWENHARQIENGVVSQLNWYQWRATELEKHLSKHEDMNLLKKGRALEIGSGPVGIVNFLQCSHRFAIDPLENFYAQSPILTKLRQSDMDYRKGTGENLPFSDNFFSLVIIDNVIDHTFAPEKILQEIHRVLIENSFLYIAVNIHTRWGAMIHKLAAKCYLDKGHPFTFRIEIIRDLLLANQFSILEEEVENYRQAKENDCRSTSLKQRIKGYSGISEFQYQAFCQKLPTGC